MQRFAIFVTKSPYDSRNAESALRFCEAAITAGHRIEQVFFYQSGVHNSSTFLDLNTDEINMCKRWSEFKLANDVPLNLCVTAAARRGIVAEDQKSKPDSNLAAAFTPVGMSEYFSALNENAKNEKDAASTIKSIQF
uniref:sulfurtransferase complex subunit TusD n=1 Tax=Ningiella ruwaisensis TaxID=2364274 RepID=UPI00109F78BB|nr:sulfurtransferase complex subunit TusD [Ningiella ruwaisensis]